MKVFDILLDSLTVVCAVVGVGFVSGKELITFVGSNQNALLFAVGFCLITFGVRVFCAKNNAFCLQDFCGACGKKVQTPMHVAMIFCYFVGMICVLAGVQQVMCEFAFYTKFPLYSFAVASVGCAITLRGVQKLQKANLLCIALVVCTIVCITQKDNHHVHFDVAPLDTTCYLFATSTFLVGLNSRLCQGKSTRQNLVVCVICSTALLLLFCVALPLCSSNSLPLISVATSTVERAIVCLTVVLCSATSLVSSALPIVDFLQDVLPQLSLRCVLVFLFALAFSLFGFDLLLHYGYVVVAIVGIVLTCCCVATKDNKKSLAV